MKPVTGLQTQNFGPPASPFATDTTSAATAVREALTNLIAALPGGIRRARDLEQALGLDYKLCWRVFNVIRANDLLAAANQVPKPPSIKRILTAAEQHGVPAPLLASLRDAANEFDRVVRHHAGDRTSFNSMVAGVSPDDGGGQIDPDERRNAYRSNVHIWGAQVDTFVAATLIHKSIDGDGVDECAINAKLGLKRFRAGARTIAYRYTFEGLGKSGSSNQQALDQNAERIYGASLLPAFCTSPMPQFKAATYGDGWATHELADSAVGLRGGVDLAFGGVVRNVPLIRDVDGRRLYFAGVNFSTPTGALLFDLLVHRPSFGRVSPELLVFKSIPGDQSPEVARRSQQLPVRGTVVPLGAGLAVVPTPEVPHLAEMVNYACQTLGWDPAEFDVYRVNMAYPVLDSVVRLQFYVD